MAIAPAVQDAEIKSAARNVRRPLWVTVDPPVMVNAAPRSASRLANVTMKAGTPIQATQNPCHIPMSKPMPIVIAHINIGSVVKPKPLTGSTSNAAKTHCKGDGRANRQINVPRHHDHDDTNGEYRSNCDLDCERRQIAWRQEQAVSQHLKHYPDSSENTDKGQGPQLCYREPPASRENFRKLHEAYSSH